MANKIIRSLQDIKTVSGRVDDRSFAYRAYMKLSVLEMEKLRRGKEKQSALDRMRSIDRRFNEIEAEKVPLLWGLESERLKEASPNRRTQTQPGPQRSGGGFKVRY